MSHRDLKEGCVRLNSCDSAPRPQLVVAWDRLVANQIARGLYLDGVVAGYDSCAVGLVRRIDFDRPICGGSPDRAASVSTDREVADTYQAFTKLLRRWTTELVGLLQRTLRERMRKELAGSWRVLGL